MKKYLRFCFVGLIALGLLSWRTFGHRKYNPTFVTGSMKLDSPSSAARTVDTAGNIITVPSKEVSKHMNTMVSTSGRVAGGILIKGNNMTLLDIGGANPNQDFTIVIESVDRSKFGQPEVTLKGKTISVSGKVIDYRGKAEIFVTDPEQLKINP